MKLKVKRIFSKLILENSTPGGIALGASIGAFISVLPVYGLHTVLVVIAAIIVPPANKVAILLGTNISLLPTLPLITWLGYELGRLILWGKFEPLTWSDFKTINFQKIACCYQPLFLGSVLLGLICAVIVYFITLFAVKKIKGRKKDAREAGSEDKEIRK